MAIQRRETAAQILATLVAALVLPAAPALAACHIVAFVETTVSVMESGNATLQVELQGQQSSCGGTVDYATTDGTASAGDDYEAISGTLTFTPGSSDDRVQSVRIPITSDNVPEADETFDVTLTNATGSFSVSSTKGRATVVIADDDADPEPTPTPTPDPLPSPSATAPGPGPEPSLTATPSAEEPAASDQPTGSEQPSEPAESPSPSPSPSPSSSPTPSPTLGEPTASDEPTEPREPSTASDSDTVSLDDVRDGSGPGGFGLLVAIVLVVIGGVGALAYRHRTTG